ncbi:hypothetical protein [Ideonella oryzae]|uniref:DUF2946 domain-containing protein n=1 Tax=Ideonella oryzae TaxID=2937441 RepID=A0ABT1BNY5_9BURK|nr:hypothetical protein [Ideonella oryzae]MCO5977931.1 hypothetical protein [Ideonella oryzae]
MFLRLAGQAHPSLRSWRGWLLAVALVAIWAQWHAVMHAEEHALAAVHQPTHDNLLPVDNCLDCLAQHALGASPLAVSSPWQGDALPSFDCPGTATERAVPAWDWLCAWPRAPPRA